MNDSAARRKGRCRGARPVGPWYVRASRAIRAAGSSRAAATCASAQARAPRRSLSTGSRTDPHACSIIRTNRPSVEASSSKRRPVAFARPPSALAQVTSPTLAQNRPCHAFCRVACRSDHPSTSGTATGTSHHGSSPACTAPATAPSIATTPRATRASSPTTNASTADAARLTPVAPPLGAQRGQGGRKPATTPA